MGLKDELLGILDCIQLAYIELEEKYTSMEIELTI
jgi:hypothetical protein